MDFELGQDGSLSPLEKLIDSAKIITDNLIVIYEGNRKSFLAGIFERRANVVDGFIIYHQKPVMILIGFCDMRLTG